MNKRNPRVDAFLRHVPQWREELTVLRSIMLQTDLVEDYKWGQPCYTHNGKNLIMLSGFKASFVVSFFHGVLLSDSHNILEFPGPNSKTVKVLRFTSIEQIAEREQIILEYVLESTQTMNMGKTDRVVVSKAIAIPAELEAMFAALPSLKKAFYALTPGRQRGYLMHISSAKQPATRRARVEKNISNILAGKGLHDPGNNNE